MSWIQYWNVIIPFYISLTSSYVFYIKGLIKC